jgi:hypothetical protein
MNKNLNLVGDEKSSGSPWIEQSPVGHPKYIESIINYIPWVEKSPVGHRGSRESIIKYLIGKKEVGQKWLNFWPLTKISTD